ncbi:MAG TPA: hypothetical protein VGM05_06010 [Planctomycetaceae bacterium]|jgi:hypothetical protein
MAKSKATDRAAYASNPPDFEVVPVSRKVRTYRLQEAELDHISDCNSTSEWFGKATCSLASLLIGIGLESLIQGTLSDVAIGVLKIIVPIIALATGFCAAKWWQTHKKISDFKSQFARAEDADLG